MSPTARHRMFTSVLVAASCSVAFLLCESVLRLLEPRKNPLPIHTPHEHVIYNPDPVWMAGITGPNHFRTNSQGLRAREYDSSATYRVVAIGGSTTICAELDDTEAWPSLVEQRLNAAMPQERVWVANAGEFGMRVADHLKVMRALPDLAPATDAVILLVGINDLSKRLAHDNYVPEGQCDRGWWVSIFGWTPESSDPACPIIEPIWKRTAVWRRLRKLKNSIAHPLADLAWQSTGAQMEHVRKERAQAARRHSLPDLSVALAEYRANLRAAAALARTQGQRLILATQPMLWRADLPESTQRLLWFGWVWGAEPKTYYDIVPLVAAMDYYNDVVREVCKEERVDCVDLASTIPATEQMFYDDCHFTEKGSSLVADEFVKLFLRSPPSRRSQLVPSETVTDEKSAPRPDR